MQGGRNREGNPGARQAHPNLSVPEHELIRQIGRGSYGEVWLARSVLGRLRAVKLLFRSRFEDEKPYEREFTGIQQFEPISRSHPGFVCILQIGRNQEQGYFYYVMEAADDLQGGSDPATYEPKTLASHVRKHGRLSVRQTIELGREIADALAHLHGAGLAHRDIKPSNILFINSRPKLGDIGLVAALDATLTYVGTPGFMPAEGPGKPSADIYSLGKVLYEAATGKDRMLFPEYPDATDFPDFDDYSELNEILIKACHTDPGRRYTSAREIARDLQLLLNGESVRRLRKLDRRIAVAKRAALIAAACAAAAAVVAAPMYKARQLHLRLQQQEIGSKRALAAEALHEGDYYSALRAYAETFDARATSPETAATESLRLNLLRQACPNLLQIFQLGSEIDDVAFTPDGKFAAAAGEDGSIHWLALGTGERSLFARAENVNSVTFTRDGEFLLSGHSEGGATIWSVEDRSPRGRFAQSKTVYSAVFTPDERSVLLAGLPTNALLIDISSQTTRLELPHGASMDCVAVSPDGKLAATGGRDALVKVWSLESGKLLRALPHGSWVYHVQFSRDSTRLLTSEHEDLARVWDLSTGGQALGAMRHSDGVRSAMFDPVGGRIVTAGYDSLARLWSASTGAPLPPVFHQGSRALRARFSPDGERLLTSGSDGTVRLYDLAQVTPVAAEKQICSDDFQNCIPLPKFREFVEPGTVLHETLEIGGGWLIASTDGSSSNYSVSMRDSRGRERWRADGSARLLANSLLSLGGTAVLLADSSRARVFDADTGVEIWSAPAPATEHSVASSCVSPHYALLEGSRATLFEVGASEGKRWAAMHQGKLHGAAFSDDGRKVALYERDSLFTPGRLYIRDVGDGKLLLPEMRHQDGILHASFSPDGEFIATGDEDASAHVFNLKTGARIGPLRHQANVVFVAFDSSGRWLATLTRNNNARLWDAATGEPISPPLPHPARLERCAFSEDGRRLLTRDAEATVRSWLLDTSAPKWAELAPFILLTTPEDNSAALQHWAALRRARGEQ